MQTARRTLVKSPPEVWEQLDHPGRMEGLMSALVGHATEVQVYERISESKLAWKANGDAARIEVELAEKGWGTNVSVSAENGEEPTRLEAWLDALLDELATPQKRPFEGMTVTPADTMAEAAVSRTAPEPALKGPPVQQTDPEVRKPKAEEPEPEESEPEESEPEEPELQEPTNEEPEVEEPEAEQPMPAATPPPEPAPRKKRFFGLF